MNQVHMTILQMNLQKGDFSANCQKVESLLAQRTQPTDILMLPEMWSVDFDYRRLKTHGRNYPRVVRFLSALAIKHQTVVVGGSIPEKKGDRLFNTTFVFNPDGSIQDRYRKMHLLGEKHLEGKLFDRGNRIPVFQNNQLIFGVATCYDILFPEVTRGIALQGASLILVPAQYSNPLHNQWVTLLKARAMENQVFVAVANRIGPNHFGDSCVIDPTGQIVGRAGCDETLLEVTLDLEKVNTIRSERFHARQIHYQAINKWVYPQNFIGVGGLVDRGGHILMVRQNYGHLNGYWLLPGGHVDRGESPADGAVREIQEETGIWTQPGELIALRNLKRNNVIDSYQVYHMEDLGGNPVPDGFENTKAAFLSPGEIFHEKPVTLLAQAIVKKYLNQSGGPLQLQRHFVKHSADYQLYL